eukprot:CAMPEP_0202884532 /NCGR_PEP_ID=MMETSP1391-20130828/41099_1 /ASSEMBLY_ACC=CAM_ASM_000867 /TAXON_ID=1034604 /ORGANISM="Chlamydomonas leiostraca, Strain SAG 11-49" /LENGTH=60 /DNA_ID=CAMNT_0049567741 /DNA_START=1 /DNA_END=180 /DNA_ORIENTATION=-
MPTLDPLAPRPVAAPPYADVDAGAGRGPSALRTADHVVDPITAERSRDKYTKELEAWRAG